MMHKLLTALAAAGLLSSVAQGAATPRAVADAMLAAINRHDAAALAALYADDAVVIASDTCVPTVGPEPVRRGHEALVRAMPDLRVEGSDWVEQGDRVAFLFTARSNSLPPPKQMILADFLTVRNGKVVRDVTIFNAGGACR